MTRAVLILAVLGVLAGIVAWLPMGGDTILHRWQTASGPAEFATRSLAELTAAAGLSGEKQPPARTGARAKTARKARPVHPAETHTDEDRAALDRIVAERSR